MDNPYWKTEGQTHDIDTESIRRICFEMSSIVDASYSLASDLAAREPEDGEWPKASAMFLLHRKLAEKEVIKLLLQISLMVRTYDDIQKDADHADSYLAHAKNTDGDDCLGTIEGMDKLDLREACNKIIHATEIRAIYEKTDRLVSDNDPVPDGVAEDIWYLTGEMELTGSYKGKAWQGTLSVRDLIETIVERVSFEPPEKKK